MAEPYPVARLADGLFVVNVPRPGGVGAANVYVLQGTEGHLLIDAGWRTPAALEPLAGALATVGITLERTVGIVLTHLHLDHCGLAPEIRAVSGAWIAAHPREVESAAYRHGERSAFLQDVERWLDAAGVPEAEAQPLLAAREASNAAAPIFELDVLLEADEVVSLHPWSLVPLHTPGHSPGHLCFLEQERRILVSGDLVLEGRASPVQCFELDGTSDPLSDFLASVQRVGGLDVATVLPGHGAPFTALRAETERLRSHHERRLAWLGDYLAAGPRTAWEAALSAPWRNAWGDLAPLARLLALGKIGAQLATLARRGAVSRVAGTPVRFALSPAVVWAARA
jgi:glyoxylase-like metal-dependent hydrolase (beta-lactamase superfamily II)